MRRVLQLYVVTMLAMSSVAMTEEMLYLREKVFRIDLDAEIIGNDLQLLFANDIPYTIPITIWGADGFMVNGVLNLLKILTNGKW